MTDPDQEKGAQQVEPNTPTDEPESNTNGASKDRLPRYQKGPQEEPAGE